MGQRGGDTPRGNGDVVVDGRPARRSPPAKRAAAMVAGASLAPAKPRRRPAVDRPNIADIATNDVLATLREIYRDDPEPCDRETLLLSLRNYLGFPALGKRIREALSGDIRAAVRRGILEPRSGKYHLLCATITQYEPTFLREMFLASLADGRNPRTWIAEAEAIRNAARHLGFTRTGSVIEKAMKRAIRALIRAGDLERDGELIRRV